MAGVPAQCPADWVIIRRVRVVGVINKVRRLWKCSPLKASNHAFVRPYSDSMVDRMKAAYATRLGLSGHDISDRLQTEKGAPITSSLLAIAGTESSCPNLQYCSANNLGAHLGGGPPPRFPNFVFECRPTKMIACSALFGQLRHLRAA